VANVAVASDEIQKNPEYFRRSALCGKKMTKITALAFRQVQRTFECFKMLSLRRLGPILVEHNQIILGAWYLIP
jgi:hypothetical protein